MFSTFIFSLRNAFRKKGVSILAIMGAALGCSLLVIMLSTTQGINQLLEDTFKQIANEITVSGQGSFLGVSLHGNATFVSQEYIDQIADIEHIESISRRVTTMIPRESFEVMDPFSVLIGIDPGEEEEANGVTNFITEGRVFSAKKEIIIGKMLIESAKLADHEVNLNDEIEMFIYPEEGEEALPTSKPEKMTLKIVGFFETGDMIEDAFVFGPVDLVREISRISSGQWSSVVVRTDSIDNVELVADEIERRLDDESIQIVVTKNLLSEFTKSLGVFNNFRFAISLVSGIAGGMGILIVMLFSVLNRRKEFGILKA
ncbi:MAG: ABC transporter permease, partial [Candidatus Bathyarchaeota archaeon]|nr:ABC transporter permease [Candidatus Bathyarchaeota archaeon]